jgi:hypothetical protein
MTVVATGIEIATAAVRGHRNLTGAHAAAETTRSTRTRRAETFTPVSATIRMRDASGATTVVTGAIEAGAVIPTRAATRAETTTVAMAGVIGMETRIAVAEAAVEETATGATGMRTAAALEIVVGGTPRRP